MSGMPDPEQQPRAKETQEIDLSVAVEVPTGDGRVVKKRLLDLTQEDLRLIAEARRAREAEADQRARDAAQAERRARGADPRHSGRQ